MASKLTHKFTFRKYTFITDYNLRKIYLIHFRKLQIPNFDEDKSCFEWGFVFSYEDNRGKRLECKIKLREATLLLGSGPFCSHCHSKLYDICSRHNTSTLRFETCSLLAYYFYKVVFFDSC